MTQQQPPPKTEQRLTFRLLSYWQRIRDGRPFPALTEVNIHEIEELWHFSFTIDLRNADGHMFQYFGPELASLFGQDYSGDLVEEALEHVILNNTIGSYEQAIAKRQPSMESAAFHNDGKEIRYRTLIVPFSSDGETIDYVMGTTNYKAF